MAARADAAVSMMMVSTSTTRWRILATTGPIFTATSAASGDDRDGGDASALVRRACSRTAYT